MTLQEFINKSKEKENKKIKEVTLKVQDFGEVLFTRPSNDELMEYTQAMMEMYTEKAQNVSEIKESDFQVDYIKLVRQSSKLLYNSCPYFRAKEVRDLYPDKEFEEIPEIIFGSQEVIRIAGKLHNIFQGYEKLEKTVDDIKN